MAPHSDKHCAEELPCEIEGRLLERGTSAGQKSLRFGGHTCGVALIEIKRENISWTPAAWRRLLMQIALRPRTAPANLLVAPIVGAPWLVACDFAWSEFRLDGFRVTIFGPRF